MSAARCDTNALATMTTHTSSRTIGRGPLAGNHIDAVYHGPAKSSAPSVVTSF